ncbi:pyroglutamyl-peptidase I family protein [Croceicoccus naphthovorans]|uniref:Pyroglutamyl-peptidase I n=1 Tax=Croceicoccus naphthovorans TaxID=1348774 RepID=A0A0G3XHE5_9SPHN|nr:hypothetical protein [Croceicoccus naphthovorans]AKM09818.1 hypothetical protein AB433_07205 [Croceicoccus naphthovorans]MBB3991253.1 pyroglutamyl-peptidase [Croceicoccus naphthovorans]
MPRPIVITAFAPFPGVADNPTRTLLESLPSSGDTILEQAQRILLPTEYRRAPETLLQALTERPAAIIMTGYSHRATCITLEARATQACLPDRPDAAGRFPDAPDPLMAEAHETAANIAAIAQSLRVAGLPAALSDDAGGYVCNHIYHAALSGPCAGIDAPPGLFVHLPALPDTDLAATAASTLPLAQMQRSLGIIARALIDGGDIV